MNVLQRMLLAMCGLAIAMAASAQEGTIRIIVGFPPGGESDVIARLLVDRMRTFSARP